MEQTHFSNEELVKLSTEYPGVFDIDMQYAKAGRVNAAEEAYLRKTVADMLHRAAQNLPQGYRFRIWDAWRSFETQKDLYDEYVEKLMAAGRLREHAEKEALQFVSLPSLDAAKPYAHGTGGAVDLTILDETGAELDMGTAFDDFSPRAHSFYFREAGSKEEEAAKVHANRMLLGRVMAEQGFTNYEEEWWHFDYGDRFWSERTGQRAIYGTIRSIEE